MADCTAGLNQSRSERTRATPEDACRSTRWERGSNEPTGGLLHTLPMVTLHATAKAHNAPLQRGPHQWSLENNAAISKWGYCNYKIKSRITTCFTQVASKRVRRSWRFVCMYVHHGKAVHLAQCYCQGRHAVTTNYVWCDRIDLGLLNESMSSTLTRYPLASITTDWLKESRCSWNALWEDVYGWSPIELHCVKRKKGNDSLMLI